MVSPFPPVSIGGYYLLLFVYATLLSLTPQCAAVVESTVLSRRCAMMTVAKSASRVAVTIVHPPRRRERRQWDPDILPFAHPHDGSSYLFDIDISNHSIDLGDDFALTNASSIRSPRRVWDPGIRLAFSPMMASLYALTAATGTTVRALSILTMPSAMPPPRRHVSLSSSSLQLGYIATKADQHDRRYRCSSTVIRF